MIGDLVVPTKPTLHPRPVPKLKDVAGTQNIGSGYVARVTNTDFYTRLMQFGQRKLEFDDKKRDSLAKIVHKDTVEIESMIHADKRALNRELNTRFELKIARYDEEIEQRRERLKDMFWKEEREIMKEVIHEAQKKQAEKYETMKQKTIELKQKREKERLKIAEDKKLQQVLVNCELFRPVIEKQRLLETKQAQLQQIQDNERKKESERELENFWHQMMLKEIEAKEERERQDKLKLNMHKNHQAEVWAIQRKEKEIRQQELEREKKEEFIKIEQLREELLREKRQGLEEEQRKREKLLKEMNEDLKRKQEIVKRREEEEKAITRAYDQLIQDTLEKERIQAKNNAEEAKREMFQFMDYIKRLEQERKDEEKMIDCLIEQERKEIDKQRTDAKCKLEYARQALKKATLQGLEEQMKYKRDEAQHQWKLKQAENKMIRFYCEQHQRLLDEWKKKKREEAKYYRQDLLAQAEYKRMLKEKEKAELERQLQIGLAEEEHYKKLVDELINGNLKSGLMHPFKKVIDDGLCACPPCLPVKK